MAFVVPKGAPRPMLADLLSVADLTPSPRGLFDLGFNPTAQPTLGDLVFGADLAPRPGGLFGLGFNPPPPAPTAKSVQLGGLFGTPPNAVHLGAKALDLDGLTYNFDTYRIDGVVHAVNAVYAFATQSGRIMYIGRAHLLSERVNASHEKLAQAKAQGATELWVCVPRANDAVDYCEAERRLIRAYCPPLNDQYNPLSRL